MTHIGSYTLQTFWCKEQAVVQRNLAVHLLKVLPVGLQKQFLVSKYGICQMLQQEVTLRILHQRQDPTGRLYFMQRTPPHPSPREGVISDVLHMFNFNFQFSTFNFPKIPYELSPMAFRPNLLIYSLCCRWR